MITLGARAEPSANQQALASANTGFAFNLLKEIAREQPARNIFISPYSVSSVLHMVCNGAGGKTREELQEVLGTSEMTMAAVNEANLNLSQVLHSGTSNVVLNSANAVWYRKGIPVKPEFLACNGRFYQAKVEGLDFNAPASVGIINAWVNEVTRGRIPSIVDGPIGMETDLYLANAVYFKGRWHAQFDPAATTDRVFHLPGDQERKVPMMVRTDDFDYHAGAGYQVVRLPYRGWKMAMYIVLPEAGSSPEKVLATIAGQDWQCIVHAHMWPSQEVSPAPMVPGTVVLPRFKLDYRVELRPPLRALGLKHTFEDTDFSGMSSGYHFAGGAVQKAFVEVNEEGTEAAAAMETFFVKGVRTPFEMIVDRPFLFVIHCAERGGSGSILFMGVVFDPSASAP